MRFFKTIGLNLMDIGMQTHKKYLGLLLLLSTQLHAQPITVTGTHLITPHHPAPHLLQSQAIEPATPLMAVKLSDTAKHALQKRLQQHTLLKAPSPQPIYPRKIDLGMNDVPVLNQAPFGTCVTFAVTAAIDAAIGQGDYVSQLCQLQLGNYLARTGYIPSGWDGTLGQHVLSNITTFGLITKKNESHEGCGGLTTYPEGDDWMPPSGEMSVEEFHNLSFNTTNYGVYWQMLLEPNQAFSKRYQPNKTLDIIKSALNKGDRVVIGSLLADVDRGIAGAVGHHKSGLDTWVLTPDIMRDLFVNPSSVENGHEMVVIGYDDDATAIDTDDKRHKGLLKLRNSWGAARGDKGDFYMTYDYFMTFAVEAYSVGQ